MINLIQTTGSALRETHDRFAESANRVANLPTPPNGSDSYETVNGSTESAAGRQNLDQSSDQTIAAGTESAIDPADTDLAREFAEQIALEATSNAQIALIHTADETLGTLFDAFA